MRILVITNQYPRLGHDMLATFNREQFRALAREHELRIIAPVPWTEQFRDAISFNHAPRRYLNRDRIWVERPVFFFPPKIMRHRYGPMYLASIRKTAQRAIEEFKPQALLSCWAHPDGWAAVQLGRETGIPVVIKVIGSDVLVQRQDSRRVQAIDQALRGADKVVAVSWDLRKHIIAIGVDEKKLHVIPEGLDQTLFCPGDQATARARLGLPASGRFVLFVGNLLLSKGIGVLMEACGQLQREGRGFHCYVVGGGYDEGLVRRSIGRLGLENNVTLVGRCLPPQLPDWYRACDVVALPSFSEGIPNVLREAVACGRPFVATRVGGIPEIADPAFSKLIAPREAAPLASAIADMLESRIKVDVETARRHSISWEASAHMLSQCLEELAPVAAGSQPEAPAINPALVESAQGRLRILVITNLYPRAGHPAIATYNREQFAALSRYHDVRIIAPVPWTYRLADWCKLIFGPNRYRNENGVLVEHPTYYFPPRIFGRRWGVFFLCSIRKTALRVVRDFQPQIVLGCWAHPDGWAAVRLARCLGLPVVVKVHGSDVLVATKSQSRRERIADALRHADGVIAVSKHLAEHVAGLSVDRQNIHVIYNGIDKTLFRPGDQQEARAHLGMPPVGRVLLFVGNLLLTKGAGVLVEACSLLRDRNVAFHCYLVGDGQDKGKLDRLVRNHALGDRITVAGLKPFEELPDWYRACDLVVLPSFSEGIPNVLREAVACGKPFVATRVGGIPEISDPSFSRLVAPGNVEELANAIEAMLSAGTQFAPQTIRAHSFSWDESARRLAEELQSVVSVHNGALHRGHERPSGATEVESLALV